MKRSKIIVLCLAIGLLASPVWAANGMVGLGAGVAPDYEGSDDTTGVPMFMFNNNYDSGRFVKLMGANLKVNLIPNKNYSLVPVLNYRMKRSNVDNDQVDLMDKVDGELAFGVFGGVDINNLLLGLEVASGKDTGVTTQATAGYRWKATPALTITPGIFTTYASDDYMDSYFSVDSSNRGGSTLPNYSADSGFKDVGINLVASYTPWENWGIMGLLSYKALLNDAKDSPVVDDVGDDKQLSAGLMVTYRWGK
jgi:outer membrane protein